MFEYANHDFLASPITVFLSEEERAWERGFVFYSAKTLRFFICFAFSSLAAAVLFQGLSIRSKRYNKQNKNNAYFSSA